MAATARSPSTSWWVSADGVSLKADMIHRSFGMTRSKARMAAPKNQLSRIRIFKLIQAAGKAADCFMAGISESLSINDNNHIDFRQEISGESLFERFRQIAARLRPHL